LDTPIHKAAIFSDFESIWRKIRAEFYTRFAPLVYDNDLPEDEEVLSLLKTLYEQTQSRGSSLHYQE